MAPTSERYDRVEGNEELEAASRLFGLAADRFQRLGDLQEPLPGWMLQIEDGHTARVPISTQVQMAAARSRDAIEAFHDLTLEEVNGSAVLAHSRTTR